MDKIKNWSRSLAQSTPFILSNTIIIVPYLLYIHLINGEIPITVLPFVLFYTLRMTGIFLIRGISRTIEKYTLLTLALLVGGAGALFSFLGGIYFPFYLLGAILLGLSGAWLPPANVTVNFNEKLQGSPIMTKKRYLAALVLLVPLLWSLTTDLRMQLVLVPVIYTLYFFLAYHGVSRYPHYELDFKGLSKNLISITELLWFGLFFGLLFLLRSARALFDEDYLNLAIMGFCAVFIIAVFALHQRCRRFMLPNWQNGLSFINGAFGNFLFLFGTFYVAVVYGKDQLALRLFLPYLVGMLLALFFGTAIRKRFSQADPFYFQVGGLAIGLGLMFVPVLFPMALLWLTFFQKSTSMWLNRVYEQTETLPLDQRVTAKYATANRGSIVHQFYLMLLLIGALSYYGFPANEIFYLTNLHSSAPSVIQVMILVKNCSSGILLLLLWMIGRSKHAISN